MTLFDAIGWIGTVLILTAFLKTSSGSWSPSARITGLVNITGSLALAGTALARGAWSIVALNIIWAAIAVRSLVASRKTNA